MSPYLILKIAGLLIAVLLLACAWLYLCARRAEEEADYWKSAAGQWRMNCRDWRCNAEKAGKQARKATGFAQDAVNALAGRQEELDRKDAEIARLRRNQAVMGGRARRLSAFTPAGWSATWRN